MPNLSALSRGTQVLAAAALLLLIDTFLPWQSIELPLELGDVSQNAWHGFWGVVMGLMVIVLLAWVIARIMDVRLPAEVPDGPVTLALGGLILLFALIKNLADDYSTIWSYLGVLLAAALAYGAWLRYQEAGGTVESLKAAMPRQQTAEGTGAGSPGTTPIHSEPDVTPTSTPPPEAPRPAEPAPSSPRTTEPMTQTGPTPPSGATAPARPTEPSAPTGPEAPPDPAAPSQPAAPETAPPPRPTEEPESERPPQPPPSSSGPR
jgi:hypothetical protein